MSSQVLVDCRDGPVEAEGQLVSPACWVAGCDNLYARAWAGERTNAHQLVSVSTYHITCSLQAWQASPPAR